MIDQQVSRLMDAYRPNPQALVQNQGVPPDLIKLLALQQLKAEKEAAMRNMQLAAAPQGEMPTVGDQLEDQVLDLTTREIAQRVGGVAQQEQQQERQNLRRMAESGIASAPGAQTAAQPRFMAASGGIVAFSEGDKVPVPRQGRAGRRSQERAAEREEEQRQAEREAAPESIYGVGSRLPAPASPEEDYGANVPPARETQGGAPVKATPRDRPALSPDFEGAMGVASLLNTPRGTSSSAPADEPAAGPTPPSTFQPPTAATPTGMSPDLRAALERTITTGLAASSLTPTDIVAQDAAQRLANVDPEAVARRFREEFPQLSADEIAQQKARIDRRRAMMAEEFDPKRQGIEQLLRMGARFSQGLTPGMAAGPAAEVGLNYAAQQRAARRAMEEGILTDEEKQMEAALTGRREGAKAGLKGYEVAGPQATAGTRGLVDIANARRLERANQLDAAVRAQAAAGSTEASTFGAQLQAQASAAATAASIYGTQVQAAVSAANNAALMAERALAREDRSVNTLVQLQSNLQSKLAETERKFIEDQSPRVKAAIQNPTGPGNAAIIAQYRRDLATLQEGPKSALARIDQLLARSIPGGAPAEGGSAAAQARAEIQRRQRAAAEGR